MMAELVELKSFNKHSTKISSLKKALNKVLGDNKRLKQLVDSYKGKMTLTNYTCKHMLEIHGTVCRKICTQQRMTWLATSEGYQPQPQEACVIDKD